LSSLCTMDCDHHTALHRAWRQGANSPRLRISDGSREARARLPTAVERRCSAVHARKATGADGAARVTTWAVGRSSGLAHGQKNSGCWHMGLSRALGRPKPRVVEPSRVSQCCRKRGSGWVQPLWVVSKWIGYGRIILDLFSYFCLDLDSNTDSVNYVG